MDFNNFCNDIMTLDPKIRFAGILGRNGDIIGGGHNVLADKLLSTSESKMSFHYSAQRWDSFQNLSHKIGNEKYSITEFEKVKYISIPLDNKNLILISSDIDCDHAKIVNEVLTLKETQQ